ncbi:hypothetical protein COU49_02730 [Candidatus Nomurabacteria bacterium CG10_big_fil_rev_8_21_14_0_10_35_16]|uniref:Haloacid dehalogenase n=1 Tax=Candidatus Nomurabacteria bacterium CG10_big_fil_rev_8_21_14_0_10_35_16 TaxID=1974731 RepID=A0A2H0TAL4_9BACT|nr:MAG: hypothetical protein COU49_02730 [Candidatus Nomurabacteria bacterium CG10_big_fil_rev_8_21_14_0_10_35_16]
MKYIFDFDDTLFLTFKLKAWIITCLEKAGFSKEVAQNYYEYRNKNKPFSLKDLLIFLFEKENITTTTFNVVYEEIMSICEKILNTELIEKVKKIRKEDCYLVSNGDQEFQMDKIERSGIKELFSEIHITNGSKKIAIEKICDSNKNEPVIFIDNKAEFFEDLDFKKYPNLKTILYTN